jgi:MYND finger
MIRYCSKEHQISDWPAHKSACTAIKKRNTKLKAEEETLHATPDDGFMNHGDPFVNGVGRFWGLLHTRNYMRARYALIEALLKVKTLDAAEAALDHLLDMLRLCRGDNMGVRNLVPHLMLRLGRDQECYDFIKWWAITAEADYDWGDMDLPYLDIKDSDAFEPVDYLCRKFRPLSHIVAATLLKARQLLAVKSCLENTAVFGENTRPVAPQIFSQIQDPLLRDVLGRQWENIDSTRKHARLVETLAEQADKLYEAVKLSNKYFWPALLNPGRHLSARSEMYIHGSVEEMQLVLQYCFDSWRENPGAIEFIKAKA